LNFTIGEYGKQVTQGTELTSAIDQARGQVQLGFLETFGKMFSRSLPESINAELLSSTMLQWKNFWMFPAIMAAGVLVLFSLTFWDKTVIKE
jgi:hypothetical protein